MDTLVVFSENGARSCYEELEGPDLRVDIVPLDDVSAAERRALVLAVIDCGRDAEAGLVLLRQFKERRVDVPVIFVTCASSEDVVLRAFNSGAREFFRNPFDPTQFTGSVEKLLHFKRLSPEKRPSVSGEKEGLPALVQLPPELPQRLVWTLTYIDRNLSSPLSLDSLAGQACLSKFHFSRLFKQHIGLSPKQYCVCRRIEKARVLLGMPDHTISLTAYRLGFNDVTEFIRQFKKFVGVTPGVYRKSFPMSPLAK